MVPKPGFTNQNPTIGSILGQNTSLMSDPTFFQDIGLQGIYTYIYIYDIYSYPYYIILNFLIYLSEPSSIKRLNFLCDLPP